MSNIVKVPFNGDELWATEVDGTIWVPVKRVCEALGLTANAQATKLKSQPWATTTIIVAVAEDGRKRELFCVHIETLPMWLATVDAARVRPEAQTKLVTFQCEAAKALFKHFLRVHETTAAQLRLQEILLLDKRPYAVKWEQRLYSELGRIYRRPYSGGRIPKWMASVTSKIYRIMYGKDASAALKDMNPTPHFGSAHHQHIHEKLLDTDLAAVYTVADGSRDIADFWSRMDWRFNRKPFQLGF